MKCGYCGKKVSGNARYCSEYCRKKGEAKANFAHKTRIPLAVILILAVIAAAVGIVLMVLASRKKKAASGQLPPNSTQQ